MNAAYPLSLWLLVKSLRNGATVTPEKVSVPYSPLGGGYGTLPKIADEPAVLDVAARLSVTASQVGLAWQVIHSPNIMIISGTSSSNHLNENVAAGSVYLDHDTLAELDSVAAQHTVGRPAA